MKKLIIVGAVVASAVLTSSALAFDREPIRLRQLKPDGWGNSTTSSARDVRRRYEATGATYCTGVIMVGHEKDSSWVHGTTRYWDKLICARRRRLRIGLLRVRREGRQGRFVLASTVCSTIPK